MPKKALVMFFLLLIGFSFLSNAEVTWSAYPEKNIKFVVAFAPGGGADLMARALSNYVNPYLNGRVYVENIPGGGGATGYRIGAKAPADGYTLTMFVTSLTAGPYVRTGYPTYQLFDPICIVALESAGFFVSTGGRFKTSHDLISFAKANPGQVSVGTPGVGSGNHFAALAIEDGIGAKFNYVPFKGNAPSMTAVMGGHVDAAVSTCADAIPYVEGKKLLPLFTIGKERAKIYPDVPTLKELNYDTVFIQWRGVGVPKNTPVEIKEILVEAFRKASEDENFKELLKKWGLEQTYLGPEEAGPFIKDQSDFLKKLVDKAGIKPQ